ncbi:matrixin family metalloprotease [Motilibacter peucedani]|uniref:matrixin family metalloprotease n=1 Tax=Motilibacter peucedani TaxID=598650 RepID=UPI001602BE31|nr:matrixin family metalloprotease [Motilibacter peucedani]
MSAGQTWDRATFGPARRRRRMTRALRALDRLDARAPGQWPAPDQWRAPVTYAPRRRFRPSRQVVAIAVVVLCLAAPKVVPRLLPATAADVGDSVPPAGAGEQSDRLLPAVAAPAGGRGFAFVHTEPGSSQPVRYDPCRALHYVVNRGDAPAAVDALVQQAAQRISAATGLAFVYDGETDEPAGMDRDAYQPDRYGMQWAPVLVAWTTPAQVPGLEGDVAGLGGSTAWPDTHGAFTYVSGDVALDAPALLPELVTQRGRDQVTAVVMHELGHVVGLAHVPDPQQLMFSDNTGQTELGAGDRRGLALVGAGPCRPHL